MDKRKKKSWKKGGKKISKAPLMLRMEFNVATYYRGDKEPSYFFTLEN